MKLNTVQKTVQSSGLNLKVKMKVAMNGKTFSVLSGGIYSEIVSTIVRELSSNAFDSHIAAGTPDLPFEVQCPTAFDPHFSVKDTGTGIRYYKFNSIVTNEHDGESTIFIDGDIREQIKNITTLIINGGDTFEFGTPLHDTKKNQTVIRISGNYEGLDIPVEFDDVLVLYSTYFESTKEDSNDFVGAFGLGSKTPLAYTDNFLVTNTFEGITRVYNVMTDEDNEPQIALMLSKETDEPNGLEVKLAVAPDDYTEFKEAIVDQLKYFEPLPKILNDEVEFPNISYKGENFWIVDGIGDGRNGGYYYNGKANAAVGNNAYEIQRVNSDLFRSGDLVLRINIGEVDVTTSREELKYNDRTCDLIREREREAIAEYTKYVMDSIDDDGMTDYEKAEFLNNNHAVIDLSSKDVQDKVGNPHYRYDSNSISIPISGWGDYTDISWRETVEYDDDGNETSREVTGINKWSCTTHHALRYSTYSRHATKSKKATGKQWLSPTQDTIVFVRDNSYSFLKKINHYLDTNNIDHGVNVLILDMFSDSASKMGFEAMKSLVSHCTTFVTLSSITLPKTINTTPTERNATPTARMFSAGQHFFSAKYWTPVYTPLTKIETEDTYVFPMHHGNVEVVSENHQNFIETFFKTGLAYDENITILGLSRVKYEKALTYGFKPVKKLVKKLRKNLVIPVSLINRLELEDHVDNIRSNTIMELFNASSGDNLSKLNDDSPILKLNRIRRLYDARYDSSLPPVNDLIGYIKESHLPKPSKFATELIAFIKETLYNLDDKLILLENMRAWNVSGDDRKQKAMIDYVNAMFPNTGETK